MTPLEQARANLNKPKEVNVCCIKCDNMVIVKNLAYCEISGKIIMDMHLETRRDNQCIEVFKERVGEIRKEG